MVDYIKAVWKSVAIKALVTFIQAAVAFGVVTNWQYDDRNTFIAGLIGAGLSAVYNLVVVPAFNEIRNR